MSNQETKELIYQLYMDYVYNIVDMIESLEDFSSDILEDESTEIQQLFWETINVEEMFETISSMLESTKLDFLNLRESMLEPESLEKLQERKNEKPEDLSIEREYDVPYWMINRY